MGPLPTSWAPPRRSAVAKGAAHEFSVFTGAVLVEAHDERQVTARRHLSVPCGWAPRGSNPEPTD